MESTQYTLSIKQKNAVDLGLLDKIDITDLAILSYLNTVQSNPFFKSIHFEGRPYYWIAHAKIISDNPFIKVDKDRLYRRLKNMCELGLIKAHPENRKLAKSYYTFTQMFHDLMFSEVKSSKKTYGLKTDGIDQPPLHTPMPSVVKTDGATVLKPENPLNEDITIIKSPLSLEKQKFSLFDSLVSRGIPKDLAEAYVDIRKANRKIDSLVFFQQLQDHCKEANLTLLEGVKFCVNHSYCSIDPKKLLSNKKKEYVPPAAATPVYRSPTNYLA